MTEYRRSKRREASESIEVHDTMTDELVGRIGNISESGMMLMTNHRLHEDALYQFRFALGESPRRTIEVGAHHLWSDGANVPGQHWAGLRFIDIGPEDAQHLRDWIERPGGKYV